MLLSVLMPLVFSVGYGLQRMRMRKMEGIRNAEKDMVILPAGENQMDPGDEFYHGNEKYDVVSVVRKGGLQYILCVNDKLERKIEKALERNGDNRQDARFFKLFLKEFQTAGPLLILTPEFTGNNYISFPVLCVPDPGKPAFFIPPELHS